MIGSPATVTRKLEQFVEETQADEVIINGQIYDQQARLRSYEIVSNIIKQY